MPVLSVDAVIQGKVIRFATLNHFSAAASGKIYEEPDNEVSKVSGNPLEMRIIGLAVLLAGIAFFIVAIVHHAKEQLL
ncbi:hypothetical protein [Bradyrhizobium sp. AUGA SZCCT0283]|jgi:hypothetical protein|uniref:hypothetical protein n=1 Tax=Bradyrhizobium sp. AUGA SZCCT0283 TaxID=2807671 RepID=UPI001BAE0102|nr:hypothetical protein [Bradyrhizobium sp. AUGA SZCCT0283]MBR1279633.1 hypothetical protein [Bradyrhizobium sp. AUGA SZCCT0283]